MKREIQRFHRSYSFLWLPSVSVHVLTYSIVAPLILVFLLSSLDNINQCILIRSLLPSAASTSSVVTIHLLLHFNDDCLSTRKKTVPCARVVTTISSSSSTRLSWLMMRVLIGPKMDDHQSQHQSILMKEKNEPPYVRVLAGKMVHSRVNADGMRKVIRLFHVLK